MMLAGKLFNGSSSIFRDILFSGTNTEDPSHRNVTFPAEQAVEMIKLTRRQIKVRMFVAGVRTGEGLKVAKKIKDETI